ncbi:hypothetical protein WQ57_06000 [Mesobacillus campisalis]|uniref:Uncharacterized protein n=1 Tax=Mesobacillus campisalis TaxID=1408103 RepID=A0A0M2T259_9BACI|nr:polysialyltransferase family glycosyltransferase [Mesobacillus campisalis]KKK38900.1 hypothetical protein WQ57_06000 [Mesobacillus campisalis]
MKILYLCFTPYHIKVSNYLSKTEYKSDENHMILSSCSGINENTLKKFVKITQYKTLNYTDIELSLREGVKLGASYFKKYKSSIEHFIKTIKEQEYDKIVYFSDNPIAYQLLFNDIKQNSVNTKLMFVEEGTGIYLKNYRYPFRYKILIFLAKILFNNNNIRVFMHGKGGFEDEVLLREPELIESKGKKIKLSKDEFREILINNDCTENFVLEKGSLFCPSFIINDPKVRNKAFNEIFLCYYQKREFLYVKLHPSEREVDSLQKLVESYDGYIIILNRDDLTSEDIIVNPNIKEVISDVSSSLINAYYLRDDIKIISYQNILIKKYGLKFKFKYSIFENMVENGIIKHFSF